MSVEKQRKEKNSEPKGHEPSDPLYKYNSQNIKMEYCDSSDRCKVEKSDSNVKNESHPAKHSTTGSNTIM